MGHCHCQTWVACLGSGLYLRHHDTSSLSSGPGFPESGTQERRRRHFYYQQYQHSHITALLLLQAGE